jgi:hypothetical protein
MRDYYDYAATTYARGVLTKGRAPAGDPIEAHEAPRWLE